MTHLKFDLLGIRHCKGFTLIELLMALTIVGLLISLLLPAIQNSRESARRSQCLNQVRQLSLGIQHHLTTHGKYPSNGGETPDSKITNSSGFLTRIGTFDIKRSTQFWWGIAKPGASPHDQPGSWAYAILPALEQGDAYQELRVDSAGPLFSCPSRGRLASLVPIDDERGRYQAAGRVWAKTDFAANAFVMQPFPNAKPSSFIQDGLANTLCLGEKAYDPFVQTPTSWFYDEPIFSGGSRGTCRNGPLIEPDGKGIAFENNWGSAHAGGANFSRFDGSTFFLNQFVDIQLLIALLTPDGHEFISEDKL